MKGLFQKWIFMRKWKLEASFDDRSILQGLFAGTALLCFFWTGIDFSFSNDPFPACPGKLPAGGTIYEIVKIDFVVVGVGIDFPALIGQVDHEVLFLSARKN